MSFLKVLKKSFEIAKKGAELMDKAGKKHVSKMSDSELNSLAEKNSNNKFVSDEIKKRNC